MDGCTPELEEVIAGGGISNTLNLRCLILELPALVFDESIM